MATYLCQGKDFLGDHGRYHSPMANAMWKNRFDAIFVHFHLSNNNNLNQADNFAKVRPLVTHLNEKSLQYSPKEEFCSFDEPMCEYLGCHGCKQFMSRKLIHFGFKVWCSTTTLGYLTWFELYQGKTGIEQAQKENYYGLGGNLVIIFANVLQGCKRKAYHICFDNFFTNVKVVAVLKDRNIKAMGTI